MRLFMPFHKSQVSPKNIPQSQNDIPPFSNSLADRSWFWQNGPASQHVRKDPTKNKFLVNFSLNRQHSASSPLSSPIPQIFGLYKESSPHPPPKPSTTAKTVQFWEWFVQNGTQNCTSRIFFAKCSARIALRYWGKKLYQFQSMYINYLAYKERFLPFVR